MNAVRRHPSHPIVSLSAVSAATLLVSACGGGGGDTASAQAASATVAGNAKPTVTLAAPTLSQSEAPASLSLKATAADSDGTIAKVEFFDGTTLLGVGVLQAGSYELTLPQTAGKTFNLTAKATDDKGESTSSAAQSVTLDPNPVTTWDKLSTAQKAGYTASPNQALKTGPELATQFMTILGQTTVLPKLPPAMSQALANLAKFAPTEVGVAKACPGGGDLEVIDDSAANGAGALRYHHRNCVIGGFTYDGGDANNQYSQLDTTVTPNVTHTIGVAVIRVPTAGGGFELKVDGLKVSGNGAPPSGNEDFPWNAFEPSRVTCTVAGATQTCLTNYNINFQWGADLAWSGYTDVGGNGLSVDDPYTLSGTYRNAHCDRTVSGSGAEGPEVCLLPARIPVSLHFRFDKLTLTSGRAIVYANDGYAVISRESAPTTGPGGLAGQLRTVQKEVLKVIRTVGTAAPVTEIYDCAFNPESGDWGTYNGAGGCYKR